MSTAENIVPQAVMDLAFYILRYAILNSTIVAYSFV